MESFNDFEKYISFITHHNHPEYLILYGYN